MEKATKRDIMRLRAFCGRKRIKVSPIAHKKKA